MASVDSEALFEARMQAVGLSGPTMIGMRTRGWNTLATFAYSCGYVPGQSDELVFSNGVLQPLVGVDFADSPESPKLRRLFFESHTLAIQDLRRRSERTDADPVLKLPAEERVVRLARLRTKYVGHDITGVLEPSHALVDLLAGMLESGQLRYVGWTLCTTRDAEIHGAKKLDLDLSSIVTDASTGFLRRVGRQEGYSADISSDLLLVQALQRRSFAMELAGICNFSVFNSLATSLLKELARPALSGYQKTSLEQIENADRFVFTRLAALTVGGVGRRADGTNPVDEGVAAIVLEPEFRYLLMQMPARGGSSSSSAAVQRTVKADRGDSRSRSRRRKITELNSKNKAVNDAARSSKGAGKSRSKGSSKGVKGKGSGKTSRFNPAVETCRTSTNRPICFGYQDGSCTAAAVGQECSKGIHVCWKIGCGKGHAGKDHP
jgi:hypothetical protein